MSEYACKHCEKTFHSAEALAMHTKAKHPEHHKEPLLSARQKKNMRNWLIVGGAAILVIWVIITLSSRGTPSTPLRVDVPLEKAKLIPPGEVHWHPKLHIIIDGNRIPIPPDIGHGSGRVIDTHLSGMGMSPTHTHESDGTIHLENKNPSSKPETLTLGYFFYVWGKTFNSTCIFDYCTDKGTLTMTVNGEEHTKFEDYLMQDNDQIQIEYKSWQGIT